jgi:chromosome segregation ATPase
MDGSASEAVFQKLCEDVAVMKSSLDVRDRDFQSLKSDIRETRDTLRDLVTSGREQNLPVKLAEMRAEYHELDKDRRIDLINAMDKIRTEVKDLTARMEALEDNQERVQGAAGVFKIVREYWPLLIGVGALVITLSEKLHLW